MRMPRKRKKKQRLRPLPILLAAALLAFVVWALIPRPRHAVHRKQIVSAVAPTPSPSVTNPAIPQESPSERPAVPASPTPVLPSPPPNAPKLAIIIDDCGQWPAIERGYTDLPIPLTLSVLPHVRYTEQIAADASAAGKGIMLHLPMEAVSGINAGPGEITTAMTDDQVTQQTEDDVAQVPLAKGINNHEGSAASSDPRIMKDVIAVAKAHGLFFIDSRTSAKTVAAQEAQAGGVPTASRDVFIDNQADLVATESMLEHAAAIAQQKGSAIAIGHPKPTTLEALRLMYPKILQEGVQFVLAQNLVH